MLATGMTLIVVSLICFRSSGWTPEFVEQAVSVQLPIGSNRADIVRFCRQHGFSLMVFDSPGDDHNRTRPHIINGVEFDVEIWATVPHPQLGLMTSGSIIVKFYLDDGRLVQRRLDVQRHYL